MPFTVVPPIIEQTDFSGGWNPDQETPTSDPFTMRDVLNLLPEIGGTGALVTRNGFASITTSELGSGLADHYVLNIHPFKGNGTSYLVVVLTDGKAAADNVRLYAIDMDDMSVARMDTAGVEWDRPTKPHWGMGIDEVYYGGSPGNDMYSWDPSTSTWNDDAGTDPAWDTWVDKDMGDSIGAGEKARDFAWRGKEIITYSGDQYMPAKNIRFDAWESGQRYKRAEKVTRKTTWGGGSEYPISWECIKAHKAGADADEPGTGANWEVYWKKVRLPAPINDDNETSDKWYFVPVAPGTSVAEWHGSRLWMRYDGQGDKSRVLYSAPVEPEKGADVPDVVWDPTDFAPGNDLRGPGGGWMAFNDGKKGGVIEALRSYGQYLVVFKRMAVWVVSGMSEDSFTVRSLARGVGCVGASAVDELDGLLYFLGDDGLYVTDGTAVESVPGFEKFANTIEARVDKMKGLEDDIDPMVFAYDDRIWISLPCSSDSEPYWTLVYEPRSGSIYKTDLPVGAMAAARHLGKPVLYFGAPSGYMTNGDIVHQYTGSTDETDTDPANIDWQLTTAWWPFGLLRAQRRIRRVWAVVKGAMDYTIKSYRDWDTTQAATVTRTVSDSDPIHIEGVWFADSHAVSFKLSSTKAPAVVYGIAVHSEPRRARYHA